MNKKIDQILNNCISLRKDNNITQLDIAKKHNIELHNIVNFENGKTHNYKYLIMYHNIDKNIDLFKGV